MQGTVMVYAYPWFNVYHTHSDGFEPQQRAVGCLVPGTGWNDRFWATEILCLRKSCAPCPPMKTWYPGRQCWDSHSSLGWIYFTARKQQVNITLLITKSCRTCWTVFTCLRAENHNKNLIWKEVRKMLIALRCNYPITLRYEKENKHTHKQLLSLHHLLWNWNSGKIFQDTLQTMRDTQKYPCVLCWCTVFCS